MAVSSARSSDGCRSLRCRPRPRSRPRSPWVGPGHEVDDGEALNAQAHTWADVEALPVGPAMAERRGHGTRRARHRPGVLDPPMQSPRCRTWRLLLSPTRRDVSGSAGVSRVRCWHWSAGPRARAARSSPGSDARDATGRPRCRGIRWSCSSACQPSCHSSSSRSRAPGAQPDNSAPHGVGRGTVDGRSSPRRTNRGASPPPDRVVSREGIEPSTY